jgi:hypothetical protein
MEILSLFLASLGHGVWFCAKLLAILVPLLTAYHVASASGRFTGESPGARRILEGMGLAPACGAPLMAGLFLGIAYGAGFLINAAREGKLTRGEVLRLCLFLCTCHAVWEDTFLFVLVSSRQGMLLGIKIFVMLVAIRLLLAVFIVRLAGRFVVPRLEPEGAA